MTGRRANAGRGSPMDAPAARPADRRGGPCGAAVPASAAWHTRGQCSGTSRVGHPRARRPPGSRRDEDGGSAAGHRADPLGPGQSCGNAPCDGRLCPRPGRLRSVYAWCVVGAALLLQAPAASAYLVKSSLYWERVGAFPHYLTTPEGGIGASWPKSGLCYNGPGCGKNTPEYRCNPDCGNPDIGIKDRIKYPKPYLIRFVSSRRVPLALARCPARTQSRMPDCCGGRRFVRMSAGHRHSR